MELDVISPFEYTQRRVSRYGHLYTHSEAWSEVCNARVEVTTCMVVRTIWHAAHNMSKTALLLLQSLCCALSSDHSPV